MTNCLRNCGAGRSQHNKNLPNGRLQNGNLSSALMLMVAPAPVPLALFRPPHIRTVRNAKILPHVILAFRFPPFPFGHRVVYCLFDAFPRPRPFPHTPSAPFHPAGPSSIPSHGNDGAFPFTAVRMAPFIPRSNGSKDSIL